MYYVVALFFLRVVIDDGVLLSRCYGWLLLTDQPELLI